MEIKVLETPGHTPEHLSYVVMDHSRGEDPAAVFTGDTLFVAMWAGRTSSRDSPGTWHRSSFTASTRDWPSFPISARSIRPTGRVSLRQGHVREKDEHDGYEKKYNYAFQIRDLTKFIDLLTTEMPEAPDHFSRCSDINRKGPSLAKDLPFLVPMDPVSFSKRSKERNTLVLDIRSYEAFGGQHVPGSYHIDLSGNFATFSGWVLPPYMDVLLVTEKPEQAWRQ